MATKKKVVTSPIADTKREPKTKLEIKCPMCADVATNIEDAKNHLMTVHKIPESMIGDLQQIIPPSELGKQKESTEQSKDRYKWKADILGYI